MRIEFRMERLRVIATSVIVTMLMTGVVSKAAVTLSTPNSSTTSYNLAAGATSSAITPPANTGVLLLGSNTTSTNFSVGSVNLIRVPTVQIHWVGLESDPSATITHGATSSPGTHVVYLDYEHHVDVEILSTDTIVVHNRATTTQAGSVKLIW